ncbi:hypothetical protein F5Y17DRAFT_184426 [Xylariaceae sp. FL0594]|nr:hypothetical protein F5Y17DRAFT_184426 [Xylariaceae sp. FL0594]
MAPSQKQARFRADVKDLCQKEVPNVRNLRRGDGEGEFVFNFTHDRVPEEGIDISIHLQNPDDYPRKATYLVFAISDAPDNIKNIFDNLNNDTTTTKSEVTVGDIIEKITSKICATLSSSGSDMDEASDQPISDWEEDGDEATYDSDDFGGDDFDIPGTAASEIPPSVLERMRRDLKACKDAGFRVGMISGADSPDHQIVSISIKASKLGVSDETRMAWNLDGPWYVVLLMKYDGGYILGEDVVQEKASLPPKLQFRLRKCSRYRPTLGQAYAAFTPHHPGANYGQSTTDREFSTFGVDGFIEPLLNHDLLNMIRVKKAAKVSWDQAKRMVSALATHAQTECSETTQGSASPVNPVIERGVHPFLRVDHLLSENQPSLSLPLVAAQCAFSYLLKCTDYCMVCQDKISQNFEAIKPYVCSKPLCLFQYMALGLGPVIDHEIVRQESVVDLLISFCYTSLWVFSRRPRRYPEGMNIEVPCIRSTASVAAQDDYLVQNVGILIHPILVEVDWGATVATIGSCPDLKTGDQVVIHTCTELLGRKWIDVFHYARIEHKVDQVIWLQVSTRHTVTRDRSMHAIVSAHDWGADPPMVGRLVRCESLDDIEGESEKAFSMILLLHTLPAVKEMKEFLQANQSRELSTWNRIPPASMRLLRWIIASNRSIILQLDAGSEERIPGFPGWFQFRFAQGSPEKEALFQEAVRQVDKPQRTIFAWHGSQPSNWHSIIREGLNFDFVQNGRAYGNGVYFSHDFGISRGYSGTSHRTGCPPSLMYFSPDWPQSSMALGEIVSLNELVNVPDKFVKSSPFYVLDVLHWFQCRYLFVRDEHYESGPDTAGGRTRSKLSKVDMLDQDPAHPVTGKRGSKVSIPRKAISWATGQQSSQPSLPGQATVAGDDTDEEDEEDAKFFEEAPPTTATTTTTATATASADNTPKTDFRPGTLDMSSIPRLAPPSDAPPMASRRIRKEIVALQKAQLETPLHDLGWYIDFEKIDNLFQWIVELHSFPPDLPLARDMKEAGITSIVLEIRFLTSFPMTPPFVRVIGPRFRPFSQGGGGNVTGGGAMCMEVLTTTGWRPIIGMESVLLEVRLAMCNLEPQPARLETVSRKFTQYDLWEAMEAYKRAAAAHGWLVPKEFQNHAPVRQYYG